MILNQTIALTKGEKARAEDAFTRAHRNASKAEPLNGISRVYTPKDDEGDKLPSESVRVQLVAENLLNDVTTALGRLFDLTATLERGNTKAVADVVVDDRTILVDVPVTYLLFLEKKLVDLVTFVKGLPILDPSVNWTYDKDNGYYRSDPIQTSRSKKVPQVLVKYEATDKHPAQVEVYQEDVIVGTWTTTRFSGAMPLTRVMDLLTRATKLQDAVKSAREKANSIEVMDVQFASDIFGYLFA